MVAKRIGREDLVIVAQHTSAVQKATGYAQRLKVNLAIVHGSDYDLGETDAVDGRSSPPPIKSIEFIPGGETLPVLTDSGAFKRPLSLVGDVKDKIAVVVENIIDDVSHLVRMANYLKQDEGAKQVHLVATHALFSLEGAKQLNESDIDEIVVTNTGWFLPKCLL